MITRKMRLSMAMLTIAASVLTTGNIKADEKDTTNETNTATESKYANKAVADIYSTTTLNIRKKGSINAKIVGKMKKGNIATVLKKGSEWSKVRSGNVTGYVKNQYLVFCSFRSGPVGKPGLVYQLGVDVFRVFHRFFPVERQVGVAFRVFSPALFIHNSHIRPFGHVVYVELAVLVLELRCSLIYRSFRKYYLLVTLLQAVYLSLIHI